MQGFVVRRADARSVVSPTCSSCSTTTTRRRLRRSSRATPRDGSSTAGAGRSSSPGLRTEAAIGQLLEDVLALSFEDGVDHIATALEWEVRVTGKPVALNAGPERANAVADIFPAYDDEEGGVLVVLTPSNGH